MGISVMKKLFSSILLIVCFRNFGYTQSITQEWVSYPSPLNLNGLMVNENQLYVDDSLNVYAGGIFFDTAVYHNCWGITKINSSGNIQWYAIESTGIVDAALASIGIDSNYNVYASGTINWNTGIVRARTNKYNINGQLEWTRELDSLGGMGTSGYGNFVSSDNYCYEHIRNSNITVRKYDQSGNVILQFTNDTIVATQNHAFIASEFKRDLENNIYVAGTYVDTPNQNERKYFVKKFNSQGALLWESFYNPTSNSDNLTGLFIDYLQNVYLSGTENVNAGYGIVVYDSAGAEKWDALLQINGYGEADDIAADNAGNCYVNGSAPGYGGLLLKYDPSGNLIWQRSIDSAVSFPFGKVKLDPDANVYVSYSALPSANFDVVTSKYDSSGNLQWKVYYSHPQSTKVTALTLDKYNNVYIAGEGFVVKYSQITGIEELQHDVVNLNIYPNPVQSNKINFSNYLNKVSLSFYDCLGRTILKRDNFNGSQFELPELLLSGIYIIEIKSQNFTFHKKIIIDNN